MSKFWFVMGMITDYDYRETWGVVWFTDKEKADKFVLFGNEISEANSKLILDMERTRDATTQSIIAEYGGFLPEVPAPKGPKVVRVPQSRFNLSGLYNLEDTYEPATDQAWEEYRLESAKVHTFNWDRQEKARTDPRILACQGEIDKLRQDTATLIGDKGWRWFAEYECHEASAGE